VNKQSRYFHAVKFLLALTAILISLVGFSQEEFSGGAPAAFGGTGLAESGLWALEYNQAGLGTLDGIEAGVTYQSPFLLSELDMGQGFVAMPLGEGGIGLSFSHTGFSLYNQGSYGLAYGRKLGEGINVGIQFNYFTLQLGEGYGSTSAMTVEGGFQFDVSEQITLAGHIANPNRSQLRGSNGELPSYLRGGVAYHVSTKVSAMAEIWKSVDNPAQIHAGVAYHPSEMVSLGLGMSSNPGVVYGGFEFHVSDFSIGVATTYHNVLGYSPQISLAYRAQ